MQNFSSIGWVLVLHTRPNNYNNNNNKNEDEQMDMYEHLDPPPRGFKKRTAYVIRITLQREVNNTIGKWAAINTK